VGGLNTQPFIIILTLLLGSILVTGIGFLLASVSKDFMSIMGWGIPVLIIMIIPALSIIFPGVVTGWVKIIPSYYLFDTVHRVTNFGSGWSEIWVNLIILAGFCAISVFAGIMVLKRRFQ
jgi:ABC-2 type transport system permease protein